MKPLFVLCIISCLLGACAKFSPSTPTAIPTQTATQTSMLLSTPVAPAAVPSPIWTTLETPLPPVHTVLSPENVTQIQELGRWGDGTIIDAVYSPEGTQLAVATALGVYLYDAETGERISFLPVENVQLASMAVSPDWQWVAIGIEPNQIELRRLSDGSLRDTFTAPGSVHFLTFTVDGQYLLAPYAAWSMNDGVSIPSTYNMSTLAGNGKTVALRIDQTFEIAELTVGSEVSITKTGVIIPTDFYNRSRAALSPDGQLLAIGADRIVEVYQVNDGTLLYTLNNPVSSDVDGLEFTPDGQMLAVIGYSETSLRQASDGRKLNVIPDASGDIAFSDNGNRMATWSDWTTLTQWNIPSGVRLNQLKQHTGSVWDLDFTASGSYLAIASDSIYLRNIMDGSLSVSLSANSPKNVAITPDERTLLFDSDNDLVFWDLTTETFFTVPASRSVWGVGDVALTSDGQVAATLSPSDDVRIWRVKDGQLLGEGYTMNGQAVAVSPTEPVFAISANNKDAIELWPLSPISAIAEETRSDTQTSQQVPLYSFEIQEADPGYLESLAFSPDGTLLAAGFSAGYIYIWRVSDKTLIQTLQSNIDFTHSLSFSSDGRMLASAFWHDGTVKFWQVADGVLLNIISCPPRRLRTITFSPDGRFLATGSDDGLVRLWGVP